MLQVREHPEISLNGQAGGALRVAIIGCGYWGKNLVRNFFEAPGCTVSYICDVNQDALGAMSRRYPSATLTTDYREALRDPAVDAVAIATQASTHYQIARAALEAGKHVWVEKPLTLHFRESQELTELAACKNLTLMVDHTFIYTGAVRRMRESVVSGELGDLLYYDSVRVNLGLYNHDVNVIWDLAVHDLAIMDFLLPFRPVAVSASAARHIGTGSSESLAYVTLHFKENFIAHFHVNWLAPVKIRLTTLCGTNRMLVYDDTMPSEKLRVYDRGITLTRPDQTDRTRLQVDYRTGDMYAPMLDQQEALQVGARHFAHCIESGETPMTDGLVGSRIVSFLEAAERSLKVGGRMEYIDW
jgi:predicted dehydrogenase